MQLNDVYKSAEEKMKKAVDAVDHEFSGLRTGRASVALIESVQVDAYGSRMPLKQMATISTPDARTLAVQPFDKSMMASVEKALLAANLGMTPNNDGKVIRLNVPPLTEERRKELVKMAKKMAEDGRVSVRNIRRMANDEIKKIEKDNDIAEDDREKAMKHVQEMTDRYVKEIDNNLAKKEKDVMEI
jgi:ribosome recycling factor